MGTPANTAPVATNDDTLTTPAGTALTFSPDDLVANDFDADGDVLSPFIVSTPANGTLEVDDMGNLVYTPNPGFTGTDTFHYTAFDGQADSTVATVTITVGDGDGR